MSGVASEALAGVDSPASMIQWDTPRAAGHSVQFYEDDDFLLDELSRFIGAAVGAGDSAIVIATKTHRERLSSRLRDRGINLTLATKQGRFLSLEAAEVLPQFMVGGMPDAKRFSRLMGDILARVSPAPGSENRRIAIFGEMVALLCADGNWDAAAHLEELWNQLSHAHSFQLHCAYPMRLFSNEGDGNRLARICGEHSPVVPAEQYTAAANEHERIRTIVSLQQKARALETEILERKNVQRALEEREAELQGYTENAVIGMHWVGADGKILRANQAELSLLGYEWDEYVGHHISEFLVGDVDVLLWRFRNHEELHDYEVRLKCKDGSFRSVRMDANVFVREGKFVHTRCFVTDITEAKKSRARSPSSGGDRGVFR